jgi:uncharacterized cupredoxin-like copper-binding protein
MKRWIRVLVVVAASMMLLAGSATAVQNVNTTTKLSVNKKSVQTGHKVTFTVKLKANKSVCKKKMPILLYKGGEYVGTFKTNNDGVVKIERTINGTFQWQAKFPGTKAGEHPNRVNCKPSNSNKITVTAT